MDYLIRFSQSHETFRRAEIEAIATCLGFDMQVVFYDDDSPFCIVRLPSEEAARVLAKRSILAQTIHELWGTGATLPDLHADVRRRSAPLWPRYETASFRFDIDAFRGAHTSASRLERINSFAYLPLRGPIRMRGPDLDFVLFEHWAPEAVPLALPDPERYYLGRLVGGTARFELCKKLDLKKRRYISTTSMDSELALVTANMALAAPGKLFYDPFVGTGSFPIAAAQWGAVAWGSDIDGRAIRGGGGGGGKAGAGDKTVRGNFEQYGLLSGLGDMFTADLTNSPIRRTPLRLLKDDRDDPTQSSSIPSSSIPSANGTATLTASVTTRPPPPVATRTRGILDGIICDPPYGVREGLFVLGCRDPERTPWVDDKSRQMYRDPAYVPPKKPYSFHAMLDDILVFAAETLVDGGRLAFWMPTANDEEQEIAVPTHPCLEIVSVCTQAFYKWSRRLITYARIPDSQVDQDALAAALAKQKSQSGVGGTTADELNPFRRGYFTKFQSPSASASASGNASPAPG